MLIGIASLSAWGLYRFNQHLASLPSATGNTLTERLMAQAARVRTAYVMQYGEIFGITAIVCVIGALLGLLISGRHEHADEPALTTEADDTPTTLMETPTRAFELPTPGDLERTATGPDRADPAAAAARPPPRALSAQQRSTPLRISWGSWPSPARRRSGSATHRR